MTVLRVRRFVHWQTAPIWAVASILAACSSSDFAVAAADDASADSGNALDAVSADIGDTSRDTGDGSTIDATSPDVPTTSSDTSETAVDTRPVPTCTDPLSFPDFGRTCGSDEECAYGLHQADCCGSLRAIGFQKVFADEFDRAEKTYRKTCTKCDCLPMDPLTESGPAPDEAHIGVHCASTHCATYVLK